MSEPLHGDASRREGEPLRDAMRPEVGGPSSMAGHPSPVHPQSAALPSSSAISQPSASVQPAASPQSGSVPRSIDGLQSAAGMNVTRPPSSQRVDSKAVGESRRPVKVAGAEEQRLGELDWEVLADGQDKTVISKRPPVALDSAAVSARSSTFSPPTSFSPRVVSPVPDPTIPVPSGAIQSGAIGSTALSPAAVAAGEGDSGTQTVDEFVRSRAESLSMHVGGKSGFALNSDDQADLRPDSQANTNNQSPAGGPMSGSALERVTHKSVKSHRTHGGLDEAAGHEGTRIGNPDALPEAVSGMAAVVAMEGPVGSPTDLGRRLEGLQLGHYLLEQFVGGGGMGAVFRATDTRLSRIVAVKVMARDRTDEDTLRRFQNEAQSAARLDHPTLPVSITLEKTRA